MNALRVLMAQHDSVERLLADLAGAGARGDQARQAALAQLSRELRAHLDGEERGFYAAVGPRLILVEASRFLEEHRGLRQRLERLEAAAPGPDFDHQARELADAVVRHFGDEEIELFPEVKRRFGIDELDELGPRLEPPPAPAPAPAGPAAAGGPAGGAAAPEPGAAEAVAGEAAGATAEEQKPGAAAEGRAEPPLHQEP